MALRGKLKRTPLSQLGTRAHQEKIGIKITDQPDVKPKPKPAFDYTGYQAPPNVGGAAQPAPAPQQSIWQRARSRITGVGEQREAAEASLLSKAATGQVGWKEALSGGAAMGLAMAMPGRKLKAAKPAVATGRDWIGKAAKEWGKGWGKTLQPLSKVSPHEIANLKSVIRYGSEAEKKMAQSALNSMAAKEVEMKIASRNIDKAIKGLDELGKKAVTDETFLAGKAASGGATAKSTIKWGLSKADRAFNTKQNKLINRIVTKAIKSPFRYKAMTAAVILLVIKEVAQSKSTALWGEGEALDTLTWWRKIAIKNKLNESADVLREIYDNATDRGLWERITGAVPYKNVKDATDLKIVANDEAQKIMDKQMEGLGQVEFDIEGLEALQTRKEESFAKGQEAQEALQTRKEESQEQFESFSDMDFERKQLAEAEMREYFTNLNEQKRLDEQQSQQFWADYEANKEAYWEEYQRKREEQAPSKLGFGLLG